MSGIIDRRSDFPKISADPLHVIIDHGLPLHRFKKDSKSKFMKKTYSFFFFIYEPSPYLITILIS